MVALGSSGTNQVVPAKTASSERNPRPQAETSTCGGIPAEEVGLALGCAGRGV